MRHKALFQHLCGKERKGLLKGFWVDDDDDKI